MHCKIIGINSTLKLIFGLFVAAGAIACGGGGDNSQSVEIKMLAKIAGEIFSCGRNYDGIGTTGTTITPQDLRFYVHGVQLISESGESVPVTLDNDNKWQNQNLALLDFEDAQGACSTEGTPDLNTALRGSVRSGVYTGISFILGVPFAMNHQDAQTAQAPQNLTAMWWNWNAGFKFLKFDFQSSGFPDGWRVHLGSTACTGNEAGAVNQCGSPNLVQVTLTDFDPDQDTISIELAGLLSDSNVDVNTALTAPGCMSGPTDPECQPIFSKLGLTGSDQSLFYVE